MPKGKRQYSRPSAGGIVRNDYHRRNRRRNVSMHSTSAGINTESSFLRILNTPVTIPSHEKDDLICLALKHVSDRRGIEAEDVNKKHLEKLCVNYLRHECSPYEPLLRSRKWKNANRDVYLTILKRVMDSIAESNPWLSNECSHQYEEKAGGAFSFQRVRVIKGGGELTRLQIEDLNARERDAFHMRDGGTDYDESIEVPHFFEALSSLDQSRFLYLPPFLKPDEICKRRFYLGTDASDRWWEWEEELGLSATAGRPVDTEHMEIKRRRRA